MSRGRTTRTFQSFRVKTSHTETDLAGCQPLKVTLEASRQLRCDWGEIITNMDFYVCEDRGKIFLAYRFSENLFPIHPSSGSIEGSEREVQHERNMRKEDTKPRKMG